MAIPPMTLDERQLWQMINIKSYAAYSCVIDHYLRHLVSENRCTTEQEFCKAVRTIHDQATRFAARIRQIDLTLLDERFPLALLNTLTSEIPPQLDHIIRLVSPLDRREALSEATAQQIREARETTCQILFQLAREMLKQPDYHRYRKYFELPRF